jgi:hypothetical protein
VPFKHSVKIIKDLLRIDISETLLQKVIHKVGDRLYKNMKNKKEEEIEVGKNALDIDLLYIQADGSMVPISKAEKIEYKENKLGVVFTNKDITEKKGKNGETRVEIKDKRFVSSLGKGVDEFKDMLSKTAIEKGSDHSNNVVFLCDGAVWLNNFKNDYYPEAIRILDWYHAVDHLWGTAHKIYGQDSVKCEEWIKPLKDKLWEGKVEDVIKYLTKLAMESKTQTPIWELRNYYENNKDAMMYNEYRDAGYYIGSGTIESANKYLVANRLKQAGMRWSIDGANSMIWLRSKYFEDQWDDFWEQMRLPEYLNNDELDKIVA